MKFTTETSVLSDALNKLGFAVNSKALLPVLNNVLVEVQNGSVTLISSDMQVSIRYNIICETEGEGEFLFPFAQMKNITALESGSVTISWTDESGCVAAFEKDVFVLGKQDAKEFPKLKEIAESKMFAIDKKVLSAIKLASLSVSKDDLRPAMMRICLEINASKLIVVSTDTHCLFVEEIAAETNIAETTELLLPIAAAKVFDDELYDVKIGFNKNTIAFQCGHVQLISIKSEGKFPNWRAIVPEYKANLTIGLEALKDAVNKAYVISDSTYNGIDFKLQSNSVSIQAKNKDLGMSCELALNAESNSEVKHIRFNGRLLKRMMAQLDGELLSFSITGDVKPVVIKSAGNDNVTVLLMPITIL